METDRINRKDTEQAIMNIEKLYIIVIGLTVAFLAVSFTNAKQLEPVHVLWLITLYVVARDWLDSTGYEFLCTSKLHSLLSLIYVLLLLIFPITLRLIEGTVLPVFAYPIIILTATIVSFLFLLFCYKQVKRGGYPNTDKLLYAGFVAEDVMAIMIYIGVLFISIMWLPVYLSWLSVIVFASAILIFENFIDRLFVSCLTKWIQNELLSTD
jgi:hypothetical protein